MAFESLHGVKVVSYMTEQTFIIGDFFAVYKKDEEFPLIYRWSEVKSVTENKLDFIINTGEVVYKIAKTCFSDDKKALAVRGIIEGIISVNPSIEYIHQKRILPPKNLYITGDISDANYIANGVYKEREINFSNVILLNTRLGSVFKVTALLAIITAFIFLHVFYGDTAKNWFYFLPVSIFAGGILVMFIYLICAVIANYHYSYLFKTDAAISEEITFAVSADGFSAVESNLHTGNEYIPWSEAAFFIETNSVFIIYKNNKAVCWLPKRLFDKEAQTQITKFIAERLYQK
ncbi:MAG: YcxB family protein [Oscillospiraceae bacterium]|nr:YcxB family protein [Oscillospiraceae bacterium]